MYYCTTSIQPCPDGSPDKYYYLSNCYISYEKYHTSYIIHHTSYITTKLTNYTTYRDAFTNKQVMHWHYEAPGSELANSMPVRCATLDQVQCQRLDPVPSGSWDQFGPIFDIGPATFSVDFSKSPTYVKK